MKLNKTWKIIIGIITAWVAIYPFVMMAFMFAVFFPVILAAEGTGADFPPAPFFMGFITFWFLIMFSSFLQMGTSIFYLIHIIKNKSGSDILRILCGIGTFYLPYIALPLYFFVYIWPDVTPEWALEKTTMLVNGK